MAQFVEGKSAAASGHVDGSGFPPMMSGGTLPRVNCHMRMPALRSSMAMMPPPAALKDGPKEEEGPLTPQPELEFVPL
jgi:hypothetical protein